MPKIGGFQSFNTARRTIADFEAMLWLQKGFGFTSDWTVNDQNDLLARLFGLQKVYKARKCRRSRRDLSLLNGLRQALFARFVEPM